MNKCQRFKWNDKRVTRDNSDRIHLRTPCSSQAIPELELMFLFHNDTHQGNQKSESPQSFIIYKIAL